MGNINKAIMGVPIVLFLETQLLFFFFVRKATNAHSQGFNKINSSENDVQSEVCNRINSFCNDPQDFPGLLPHCFDQGQGLRVGLRLARYAWPEIPEKPEQQKREEFAEFAEFGEKATR